MSSGWSLERAIERDKPAPRPAVKADDLDGARELTRNASGREREVVCQRAIEAEQQPALVDGTTKSSSDSRPRSVSTRSR